MNSDVFTAKNGKQYEIRIDDSGEEITVWLNHVKRGSISLRWLEGPEESGSDWYHITHLALDGCKGQGIGRRCLELHHEWFGSPITAGNAHDGQIDDGSHLTGNGPGFISKMRAEGLVVDDERERFDSADC